MILRKHQAEVDRIAVSIAGGAPIKRLLISVTPGGGKSALPGILAERLFPFVADRIMWVVPRDSLRAQGEEDFPVWSRYRIRAAGNETDPCRGTHGFVTTYQSIVANPVRHLSTICDGHRWIIFFDEPHHVSIDSSWDKAIAPLVECAVLVAYASGTFARGDGLRIAGIPYRENGQPNFGGGAETAVVRYSRTDALREGAIVPVSFRLMDGRAEWMDESGERQSSDSLDSRDYAAESLFTALRTEFAVELLDSCVADWIEHRRDVYPAGKLLAVAPNIALASVYQEHLRRRGIDALIATSDDSTAAADAIARFKGQAAPAADVLVTVAMAYEGMSVPAVSHIACLTHIRSMPWLEQCFARANRTAPGKDRAIIYGPKDGRFREAIDAIEAEQVEALSGRMAARREAHGEDSCDGVEGGGSGRRPWIQPIGSAAYRGEGGDLFAAERPDGGLTPSQAETTLRTQIARHIETVVGRRRPGSKGIVERVIVRTLKDAVGGKGRAECTTEELVTQWAILKERWPL